MYAKTCPFENIKEARSCFRVDRSVEGGLVWITRTSNRMKIGDPAGTKNKAGYWQTHFHSRRYYNHRFVWYIETGEWPMPPYEVDHIDGDTSNNRIENLSVKSRSMNIAKSRKRENTSSIYKNVSWHNRSHKWAARVPRKHLNVGRRKHIGYFSIESDAAWAVVRYLQRYSPDENINHPDQLRRL